MEQNILEELLLNQFSYNVNSLLKHKNESLIHKPWSSLFRKFIL